jgi:hypothetical protein
VRLTRVILTALGVATCLPSVGSSQYAPKWRVGDWWVVKTWVLSSEYGISKWNYARYHVAGAKRVGNRACYVLETYPLRPDSVSPKSKDMFYVRTDDWLVVRRTATNMQDGRLHPPQTTNYPLGQTGPFRGGLHLPRFPLQLGNPDTTFRLARFEGFSAWLRELNDVADSSVVNRLLSECESDGGRSLRPAGKVYRVSNEADRRLEPDEEYGNQAQMIQSLQLWSEDLPWRVYEELVQYDGPSRFRTVLARSWLIAVGHKGK